MQDRKAANGKTQPAQREEHPSESTSRTARPPLALSRPVGYTASCPARQGSRCRAHGRDDKTPGPGCSAADSQPEALAIERGRQSDGLVGVNLCVNDLRPDAHKDPDTPLDMVVRHFTYLVDRIGIDRVALGSDFDGATIPAPIGDAGGLQDLIAALRATGFDEASLSKIGYENWLRVLKRAID